MNMVCAEYHSRKIEHEKRGKGRGKQVIGSIELLKGYQVVLNALNQDNYQQLREWRNQDEVRLMMRNTDIVDEATHNIWFNRVMMNKQQRYFVIKYKEQLLGAINIRSTDGLNLSECHYAEVGLYLIHPAYKNNIIAFSPSLLMNDFAFNQLNIKSLASEVKADNMAAIKYNQALGYQLQPEQNGFIGIRLNKADYQRATIKLKQFLSR